MKACYSKSTQVQRQIEISAAILKAVSEPNRLRVLCALSDAQICVCKLADKLGISRNLLSFHLKTLYEAGLLDKRREGNKLFFFIKDIWKARLEHLFSFIDLHKLKTSKQ